MGIGGIGPMELVIVLVIALIILGPKRLPEVGRSIGHGMREFKDSISGGGSKDDDEDDDEELTLGTTPGSSTPSSTTPSSATPSSATPTGTTSSGASK